MHYAGDAFRDTLTGAAPPEQLTPNLTTAVNAAGRMQLGRLYLAAARMRQLEQAGTPTEQWWAALRFYLEGLERGDFDHKQRFLVERWASAYQGVGVDAGTAYGLAIDAVGHPHGPFLEYFLPRLAQLIDERDAAGDSAAADLCRRLRLRLLRQWVLTPGAVGLRLQAAERLAEVVEQEAVARDLRAWRANYLGELKKRPVTVLEPHNKPAPAPSAHAHLLQRAALISWLAAAGAAAAVVSLLLFWAWRAQADAASRSTVFLAGAAAAVIICGGMLWLHFFPEAVREDFRRDFSSLINWPRRLFLASGITLLAVVAAGLLHRSERSVKSSLAARTGAIATGAWCVLALATLAGAWTGRNAQMKYQVITRAVLENPVELMCGAESERLLESLRRQQP